MIEVLIDAKWHPVTPTQAYILCAQIMNGVSKNKVEVINRTYLRGITFQELEKEVSSNVCKTAKAI